MKHSVKLYVGDSLGKYGFPGGHAFGPDRQDAFWREALKQGLDKRVGIVDPRMATEEELHRFHTARNPPGNICHTPSRFALDVSDSGEIFSPESGTPAQSKYAGIVPMIHQDATNAILPQCLESQQVLVISHPS